MKRLLILTLLLNIGCSVVSKKVVQEKPRKPPIKIAIVDTGVDFSHSILKDYKSIEQEERSQKDTNGHGTHVAGIVAINLYYADKNTRNDFEILSFKADSKDGSFYAYSYFQAVQRAIDSGAKIINLSLEGPDADPFEERLLKSNPTVIFVVAAGNDGKNKQSFPCSYNLKNVICVSSMDEKGEMVASATRNDSVRYIALGYNILSFYKKGMKEKTGTSQATALVSAYLGLKLKYGNKYDKKFAPFVKEYKKYLKNSMKGL